MTSRESRVEDASKAPVKADFSAIPLPPEGAAGETTAQAAKSAPAPEVAVLEFLDPLSMATQVDLRHPFRHPVSGAPVHHVVIRRLSYAEVVAVFRDAPKDAEGGVSNIEFFAAMTGLPAAVIRGMEATDGNRVTDACLPFLPRDEESSASS